MKETKQILKIKNIFEYLNMGGNLLFEGVSDTGLQILKGLESSSEIAIALPRASEALRLGFIGALEKAKITGGLEGMKTKFGGTMEEAATRFLESLPKSEQTTLLSKFSGVASEENIAALVGLEKAPNIETSVKDLASDVRTMLEKRKTSGGSLTQSELILINDSIKTMESKAVGNVNITKVVNGVKAEVDLLQNQNNLKNSEEVVTTKTTVNLDQTQGGTLETKPEAEITTNADDLSNFEVYVPKYEWRFGGDLENHVGEFKSDWFSEDLIDMNKLGNYPDPFADEPVSYIDKFKNDVDEEFPESDYFIQVIKSMRNGFNMIEHGTVDKTTWDFFPTGGFERYGIDNFREWIKKLYKDKRLKVKTYATDFWTDSELGFAAPKEEWKHSGPLDPTTETFFDFEVLPEPDKNLWKIKLKNPQKTPFEVEYTWKLNSIKNDPNLTEKQKSDEILKAYNEYLTEKGKKRERDKYWYKFDMKKPKQDPDLNESVIKEINKIKKLL